MISLRQRMAKKERLNGVFLKTPAPHLVELSALAGCAFVSPDMEHAPIDLGHVDAMVGFAGRSGIPVLPRVPSLDPSLIGRLLDVGAAGILVPRVSSAEEAEAIVASARFERGQRGFSPSPRAGAYGTLGAEPYLKQQNSDTVVALQIEDRSGLEAIEEIASVSGIDALFVGPADLSISLGVAADAPELEAAIGKILSVGRNRRLACGIFVASGMAVTKRAEAGFTWFIIGSDQAHYQSALRHEIVACA